MKLVKYELYENGKFIGEYNSIEIQEKIGLQKSNLYKYVSTDRLYKRIYYIKKRDEFVNDFTEEDAARWDEIRMRCQKALENSDWSQKRKQLDRLQPIWRKRLSENDE